MAVEPRSPSFRRRWMGTALGAGAGMLAGAAVGAAMPGPKARKCGEGDGSATGNACAAYPLPRYSAEDYEFCSQVVWSDTPKHRCGDLEDSESIEAFVSAGWELVDVIVPFQETRQLELSYPGNTRKLIAYFRRPRERGHHETG